METGVSNTTHSLFDLAALNQNATEQYHLSIQLGLDGFSFCIRNSEQILAIESYHHALSQLEEIIKNHEWLSKNYASTNVSVVSKKHTLIPEAIYEPSKHTEYLQFNHNRSEKTEVVADKLQQIDAHQVYGISVPEQEVINTFFPKASIRHYSSTLIDNLLAENKSPETAKLFVNIQGKHMDVVAINHNGLQLFNSFRHQSAEDFIYYTLFVCEQLNLNPEEINLCFLGELEKQSEIYDLAYKYIRNIQFIKRNSSIQLSPVINQVPEHFYYSLLHQHLCV
jgi:hypothetical protein